MTDLQRAELTGLSGLEAAAKSAKGGPDSWNPPFCGDIDMRIAADGTWFYQGSPIGRKALVQLFSRVLRREADGSTYLVTPVEKVRITVADAAFVAVEMIVDGFGATRRLRFRTQVDEWLDAGEEHPLRFDKVCDGGLKPYIHVRGRLEALVVRAVYYDLVELGEMRVIEGVDMFGVSSGGKFFPMAPLAEIEGERR